MWFQLECSWVESLALEWNIFRCLGYIGRDLFVKVLWWKVHFKIQNWLWELWTEIAFSSFKVDSSPSWNNTFANQRVKQYFTFEERVLVNTHTNYLFMEWQMKKTAAFFFLNRCFLASPDAQFKIQFNTNAYLAATMIQPCCRPQRQSNEQNWFVSWPHET